MDNNEKKLDLLNGDVKKVLILFALPFVYANILQALYGAVDLFVIGRFCDSSAVSAVGIGTEIMQAVIGIIFGFTSGGTVIIGQYFGADKKKCVRDVIGTMIILFGAFSLIMTVVLFFVASPFIEFLRTPKEAVNFTLQYLVTCSFGILFLVAYNVLAAILRGLGDSKTPMKFIILACCINIVCDFILIGFFKMGPMGAAIATIFAQFCAVLFCFFHIKKHGGLCDFTFKDTVFSKMEAWNIFKIGAPMAVAIVLIDISFLIMTGIINSMGLIASASLGVAERLLWFSYIIPESLSAAVAAMTAQNIGASQHQRAKKCFLVGFLISLAFELVLYIFIFFKGELLTAIFTTDPDVIKCSADYMRSFGIECVIGSFIFNINSFFIGYGHTTFPVVHSIMATFLVRIPMSYYLSKLPNATMFEVGFAAPLASILSVIMCIFYYKTGRWRISKILNKE